MTEGSNDYMTRTEVKNYTQTYTSELIFGALAGVLIAVGAFSFIDAAIDEGLGGAFALNLVFGWALFLIAGIFAFFLMLQNRKKRRALED